MNREELLDKVRKCVPNFGWEDEYPDLYGKYGMGIYGICEGWHWFEEDNITEYARNKGHLPLTDATDNELLQMWAIADHYWLEQYKEWYYRADKKSRKLDMFIGKCERRYFGYDEDGYTDKTIDRIFNSIFTILDTVSETLGEVPNTCGECKFIGRYEDGPYSRNPHCCCELVWDLKEEDYKVNKNSLDENCPLKVLYSLNKN